MCILQPNKTLLAGIELGSGIVMPVTTLECLQKGKLLDEWWLDEWICGAGNKRSKNRRGGSTGVGRGAGTGQFPSPGMKADVRMRRLTHSHVVGIKASESLLIGEIRAESDGHEGARGKNHFLAGGLLRVSGLSATEGCQHLIFCFYLWGQRGQEQDESFPCQPLSRSPKRQKAELLGN